MRDRRRHNKEDHVSFYKGFPCYFVATAWSRLWQLKELQDKQIFDFYEIIDGNLVVYYQEMPPNGQNTFNLDLKAEIPGSFLGTASSAYLYYTNEYKHWADGSSIVIRESK